MKKIQCDVCHNEFEYEEWDIPLTIGRPAEELPDGYLIFGKWICMDCGSCSECGSSLEKSGNMELNEKDKLCRDCVEEEVA